MIWMAGAAGAGRAGGDGPGRLAGDADPETVYTAEEEAEVEDRLRNLGYL